MSINRFELYDEIASGLSYDNMYKKNGAYRKMRQRQGKEKKKGRKSYKKKGRKSYKKKSVKKSNKMSNLEASQFSAFLKSRGVSLWADHDDFLQMPPTKMREIMTTFSEYNNIIVSTTRSFPHKWSFSGNVEGEEITLNWTGPKKSNKKKK